MPELSPLVNATAGQRLGAKLIDWIPALAVAVAAAAVFPGVLADDAGWPVGLLVAAGVAAAYLLGILLWEGMTGKSPGNLLLGLRTTGRDGLPPGIGAALLRGVVLTVSWVVPVVGPVLMLVSNRWDADGSRRGWHDKAAGTLMVDVRAGRDPLTTGGLFGGRVDPAAAKPAEGTSAAGDNQRSTADAQGRPRAHPQPAGPAGPIDSVPSFGGAGRAAASGLAGTRGHAGTAGQPAQKNQAEPVVPVDDHPVHPDAELEMTRIARSQPAAAGVQLVFDDGAVVRVPQSALLGRNPAGKAGETVDQLIDFADLSRSVSKTHLHLRVDGAGVWVTDRNSTNGSAASTPEGVEENLHPGRPVLVPVGSTVHFGDRHFIIRSA